MASRGHKAGTSKPLCGFPERPGVRKQKISDQIARRAVDTLEVVKVETGKGLS